MIISSPSSQCLFTLHTSRCIYKCLTWKYISPSHPDQHRPALLLHGERSARVAIACVSSRRPGTMAMLIIYSWHNGNVDNIFLLQWRCWQYICQRALNNSPYILELYSRFSYCWTYCDRIFHNHFHCQNSFSHDICPEVPHPLRRKSTKFSMLSILNVTMLSVAKKWRDGQGHWHQTHLISLQYTT